MLFFELTHPEYETDADDEAANPVQVVEEVAMPGIICPACGPWAGSRRLYLPVDDPRLRRCLARPPLPVQEWLELAGEVRRALALPDDVRLLPGDVLGSPAVELLRAAVPDFLHPFPGRVVVKAAVVRALADRGLTGYRPIEASVRARSSAAAAQALPRLFELLIRGEAWSVGQNRQAVIACEACGRTAPGHAEPSSIDEGRWDGSDFFTANGNPNVVYVTEAVCRAVSEYGFSNVVCRP
jgi:hypothetical protein